MRPTAPRDGNTTYARLDAHSGDVKPRRSAAVATDESTWLPDRSRSQLALLACVALVLTVGGSMSLWDHFAGPGGDGEDVGAPAVTGKPASTLVDAPGPKGVEGVEKRGSGLMFLSGGEVLLLKRNSLHNRNTWGLPGGNIEDADGDSLFKAAKREAEKELGSLPPFVLGGRVHTIRGKDDVKHYTVFLAVLDEDTKRSYAPLLNEEHSAWHWFPLKEAFSRKDLHPVVSRVFKKKTRKMVLKAAEPGFAESMEDAEGGVIAEQP